MMTLVEARWSLRTYRSAKTTSESVYLMTLEKENQMKLTFIVVKEVLLYLKDKKDLIFDHT